MNGYERLMHEAHLKYQRAAHGNQSVDVVDAKVRAGIHRIAGKLNMSLAQQAQWCLNYYRYFCNHDRLLIEACSRCKRKGLVAPK